MVARYKSFLNSYLIGFCIIFNLAFNMIVT